MEAVVVDWFGGLSVGFHINETLSLSSVKTTPYVQIKPRVLFGINLSAKKRHVHRWKYGV